MSMLALQTAAFSTWNI